MTPPSRHGYWRRVRDEAWAAYYAYDVGPRPDLPCKPPDGLSFDAWAAWMDDWRQRYDALVDGYHMRCERQATLLRQAHEIEGRRRQGVAP